MSVRIVKDKQVIFKNILSHVIRKKAGHRDLRDNLMYDGPQAYSIVKSINQV